MTQPIYLDYAATTPVDVRVAERMMHYLTVDGVFGNPSSKHLFGLSARCAIEQAREQVASLIKAESSEIIWTSGATEANNLALKGAAALYEHKGKHIVTLTTEHKAVLDACQFLEKRGFQVTMLSPKPNGRLDLALFESVLREDTIMVSVMWVNNEIGVVQDIHTIAQLTASRGILLHVDAAQAAGKIPINVQTARIDLMSLSAHKVYGPKGMGALYVRKKPRVRVQAQLHGGGHEQGLRSGTLATHQIVGMGEAFALAQQTWLRDQAHIQACRSRFLSALPMVRINGEAAESVPHILNLRFANKTAEDLLATMPNLGVSMASACLEKGNEPSYVLRALGLSEMQAKSPLRFSFGRMTTLDEIDRATQWLRAALS